MEHNWIAHTHDLILHCFIGDGEPGETESINGGSKSFACHWSDVTRHLSVMKRILLSALLLLTIISGLWAQTAPATAELTKLLQDFLAGAGRNDIAMHERFWADDLIYTSAKGRRKGKADILRELREEAKATPTPGEETVIYTAEEIRLQQYGDTAIVAFRLVATTDKAGTKTVANYFNTGTFLKRNGKWQAVGWQATAIPKEATSTPTP
jgi:ketosteroid isomerase-like protein